MSPSVVGAQYTLRFGDAVIADVVGTEYEFPGAAGRYTLVASLPARVLEYHAYSLEEDAIGVEDDYGERWQSFMDEHESAFLDLIDSDAWALVAADGTRLSITVPLFPPTVSSPGVEGDAIIGRPRC